MMKIPKGLRIAGYIVFGVTCFALSLYWTFPAEQLGRRLSQEVFTRSQGRTSIEFKDLSLYRGTGIEAHGIQITQTSDDGQQPMRIQIAALRARVKVLPLLLLRQALSLDMEVAGGLVEAQVSRQDGMLAVDLDLLGVDLSQLPLSASPLAVQGRITGTVSTLLASAGKAGTQDFNFDLSRSTGKADWRLAQLTLGPGTVEGFTVPSVDMGAVATTLAMDKGELKLLTYDQTGGSVKTKLTGSSTIRSRLSSSSLKACLEFKADDAFLEKNQNLKAALSIAEVQLSKGGDGALHVPLSGTFGRLRLTKGLCGANI